MEASEIIAKHHSQRIPVTSHHMSMLNPPTYLTSVGRANSNRRPSSVTDETSPLVKTVPKLQYAHDKIERLP